MKRSIRRHQKQVAKARRIRILKDAHGWPWDRPFMFDGELISIPSRRRAWHPMRRLVMNEPGYWVHEMMTRPARIRTNQLLRKVLIGAVDADGVSWPDNRKPHLYYW